MRRLVLVVCLLAPCGLVTPAPAGQRAEGGVAVAASVDTTVRAARPLRRALPP